jgi:4-amino-4-deoxy-L-arabinose transferase-like glycosyltransferase
MGAVQLWIGGAVILAVVLDLALMFGARRLRKRVADPAAGDEEVVGPFSLALVWIRSQRPRLGQARDRLVEAWHGLPGALAVAREFWRSEVWASDQNKMRLLLVAACLLVSLGMGYAYAQETMVEGWQLWTWAIGVVAVAYMLMPAQAWPRPRARFWLAPLGLALVALALRAPLLETVPGGLHPDEARLAEVTLRHVYPDLHQTLNPFSTSTYSQPALYNYLVRLSLAVVGNSITGLRLPSALAGAAAVAATFLAVSVLENRRIAWLTALLMAFYHYHIHWSRLALNNVWDTLWVPVILGGFAWSWKKRWSGGAVLTGLALGFSQFFYAGSRIGVLLLAYLIYRQWRQGEDRKQLVIHVGKLVLMAAVVAGPLVAYALKNPDNFFEHPRKVFGWQPDLILTTVGEGSLWTYFWYQLGHSLGAYTTYPDVTGFYAPDTPLIIGLAAPLFVLGALWAIVKRRYLPLLWVLLTVVLGGILLSGAPSSSRFAVSIPAVCWLTAIPLEWLMASGRRRLAIGLLVAIIAFDLFFYFGVYATAAHVDLTLPFPSLSP